MCVVTVLQSFVTDAVSEHTVIPPAQASVIFYDNKLQLDVLIFKTLHGNYRLA